MPTMTKRVNIQARTAVRNTNPPIYGTINDIIMSTGDILKCLVKKATVDEILPDGSTVRLNYKNYYIDNGAGLDAMSGQAKIKPKKNINNAKKESKVTFIDDTIKETNTTSNVKNSDEDTKKDSIENTVEPKVEEPASEDTVNTDDANTTQESHHTHLADEVKESPIEEENVTTSDAVESKEENNTQSETVVENKSTSKKKNTSSKKK